MLIPERQSTGNQHLCTGSKFHSCTTPSTKANCAKAGTQSAILPSPSSPKGGKERGVVPIYQLLLLFLFVLGLFPTCKYKPEKQSKDGTLFLVSVCFCVCLPGAARN